MQFYWAQKKQYGQLCKLPLSSGKESPVTIRYKVGWAGSKKNTNPQAMNFGLPKRKTFDYLMS